MFNLTNNSSDLQSAMFNSASLDTTPIQQERHVEKTKVTWGKKGQTTTVKTRDEAVVAPPPPVVPYTSELASTPFPNSSNLCLDMDLPSLSNIVTSDNTSQRVLASAEKPPDRIVDSYVDDYNILEVDDIIHKKFLYNRKVKVEELRQKVVLEKVNLLRPQTIVERKATQSLITRLSSEIEAIMSERDLFQYQKESTQLLEHYRTLGTKKRVVSFKTAGKNCRMTRGEPSEDDEFRHLVIARYLDIARRYIQVDVTREIPLEVGCPGCGGDFEEIAIDDENVVQYCDKCGVERYNLLRNIVSAEATKIPGNGYDDQDNFLKALRRYQGKQQNHLNENLFDELDEYFASFNLPTSDEVLQMELTKKGTRGKTTKDQMLRALLSTKNVAYYEDANLICHLYWGWTLPDVSHLEDQILDDYKKTQQIYETLPKMRKSNLNIQYRLFKHLQMRGHECDIDDFKMVKTRDILEYHDTMWKQIIEKAIELYNDGGFTFHPTI